MSTPAPDPSVTPPAAGDIANVAAWRIMLRMLAGFIAMFSFAFWAAAGWNRGWTQNSPVPIKHTDRITGTEVITYKDHFMPGMDLFAPALILCLTLFTLTFIRRKAR